MQGGVAGAKRLQKSRILKKLLEEQDAAGRICGEVCSSPAILHKHGLLKIKTQDKPFDIFLPMMQKNFLESHKAKEEDGLQANWETRTVCESQPMKLRETEKSIGKEVVFFIDDS